MAALRLLPRCTVPRLARAFSFDAEMSKLYTVMAENHRHPQGPWCLMAAEVRAHATPGAKVLDLASGPGEPAATIAKLMPELAVVSSDASADMVATAKQATAELPNVSTAVADLENLGFEDNSMDVVTCCYGYMFPENKALALRETLRVLKPGGVLVATTWDRLDILKIARDIMRAVLGAEPPPPAMNPMSLSEEGLFRKLVEDAGFQDVTQTVSTYPFNYGSDSDFQFKVATMLLREKLDSLGGDAWKTAEAAFRANVAQYTETAQNGDLLFPGNTFRMTVGKKLSDQH